jgi:hypothetical protein
MSVRITESQLRKIVREEYLKSQGAVRRRPVMTEARARRAADEMMNEGLFDVIKAGISGLMGGAGKAKEMLGAKAIETFKPISDAIAAVSKAASTAASNVSKAIGEIKDASLKAAAEKFRDSLKESMKNALKTQIAAGVKELTAQEWKRRKRRRSLQRSLPRLQQSLQLLLPLSNHHSI